MNNKFRECNDLNLVHDENASTISLILTIVLLGGIVIGLYLVYQFIVDSGGISGFFEDLGVSTANAGTGFIGGVLSGLWNTGKSIGNKWNPFD